MDMRGSEVAYAEVSRVDRTTNSQTGVDLDGSQHQEGSRALMSCGIGVQILVRQSILCACNQTEYSEFLGTGIVVR
jgi:hypothetical protein